MQLERSTQILELVRSPEIRAVLIAQAFGHARGGIRIRHCYAAEKWNRASGYWFVPDEEMLVVVEGSLATTGGWWRGCFVAGGIWLVLFLSEMKK